MTAQEVIDLAKNGELKTIAVKDSISAVIGFINLGLIELYKRFPIETKEYIIEAIANEDKYKMPTDYMWLVGAYHYAVTAGNYLSAKPEDITTLDINSDENPNSVNTIGYNLVQIGNLEVGHLYSLVYVASPTLVTEATLNDQLPIPAQMLEAILNYIGYRGHGSVNGNIQAESTTHYQRFELSVKRIEMSGMFNSESVDMYNRIQNKGFM
jgi:hypothetical protein